MIFILMNFSVYVQNHLLSLVNTHTFLESLFFVYWVYSIFNILPYVTNSSDDNRISRVDDDDDGGGRCRGRRYVDSRYLFIRFWPVFLNIQANFKTNKTKFFSFLLWQSFFSFPVIHFHEKKDLKRERERERDWDLVRKTN